MNDYIKITPDLIIDFCDLMCYVDTTHEFTLGDVFRAISNDDAIPILLLGEILKCPNLKDYCNDAAKDKKDTDDTEYDYDYLELYYGGAIDKDGCYSCWDFHGVGKMGEVPDEAYNSIDPELKPTYRQAYAIELMPLSALADYKIKICKKISLEDDRTKDLDIQEIDFQPCITLIDLLYWIMYELSFFGSPKERDETFNKLKGISKEISDAIKDGTIDEITTPYVFKTDGTGEPKQGVKKEVKPIPESLKKELDI